MSLEYTRKGKIGITIISIWFIISTIFAVGGIIFIQLHTSDFSNINMNQVTMDYYISVGGLISIIVGTTILFTFKGINDNVDWYEWKENLEEG